MEYVIVTGASSGIGKAIAHYYLSKDYTVIGIGRDFKKAKHHENFIPVICDLTQAKEIQKNIVPLVKKYSIKILVNAAGFGRFEPHEELDSAMIESMTAVNLTAPMKLSNLFLRSIKEHQGMIINITSIEATRHAKFSALYSATKAGLRAFGLSLFEEVRKSGVKVITLNPDMTDTPFFDKLRFQPAKGAALNPKTIIHTLDLIMQLPEDTVITELTIRPQYFKLDKKH